MAGHSQFKNIMHRKGAQDKKRAKKFNKIAREITVAAKTGLPDPDHNARLRNAIVAARVANMPNSRIKSAIDAAKPGSGEASNFDSVRYEGFGPHGVAVIVEALTDNRNRTAGDVRAAFTKSGGALGESNSVAFMFVRQGIISYPLTVGDFDRVFAAGLEAGVDDVLRRENGYELIVSPEILHEAKEKLALQLGSATEAEVVWTPLSVKNIDAAAAKDVLELVDILEDNDDVQNVYTNMEADIAAVERLLA